MTKITDDLVVRGNPIKNEAYSMQMDMRQAAISACEIGFDGVEYHFAHGFTLCKFLDGSYNNRTDQYGGNAENRARILTELLPIST